MLQLVFGRFHVRQVAEDYMKGCCVFSSADSPNMQMMPAFYAGSLAEGCFQLFQLNLFRNGIQT